MESLQFDNTNSVEAETAAADVVSTSEEQVTSVTNTEKHPELVGVGHICMDRIFRCSAYPEENGNVHILGLENQPGGTVSQALVAYERLGGHAGLISLFADDSIGQELYDGIYKEGIDLSVCEFAHGVTSHFSNVMVNVENGSRTFFSYHGDFAPLTFNAAQQKLICQAKVLHLDGTHFENALHAAQIAKKNGILVSLDGSAIHPDREAHWQIARLADILICSDTYPARLTGESGLQESFELLSRELPDVQVLICTLGEKGCLSRENGKILHYPAYSINAIDTTGAGDAFHGAFLYGYLHGYSQEESIRLASAVAAMNCEHIGGRIGLPSLEKARQFIAAHAYSSPSV